LCSCARARLFPAFAPGTSTFTKLPPFTVHYAGPLARDNFNIWKRHPSLLAEDALACGRRLPSVPPDGELGVFIDGRPWAAATGLRPNTAMQRPGRSEREPGYRYDMTRAQVGREEGG
jgi:hypothetical protein